MRQQRSQARSRHTLIVAAGHNFAAPSSQPSSPQQPQQPDPNHYPLAVYRFPLGGGTAAVSAATTEAPTASTTSSGRRRHRNASGSSTSLPPARRWTSAMWFEAMVQTVVKQLDGGAFLLRVGFNPGLSLSLVRLDAADLAAGWDAIAARHLAAPPAGLDGRQQQQQDEAVILVHPVASDAQPCVVQQVAGDTCPGCPHTSEAAVAAAAAADAAARGGGVTAAYAAAAPAVVTPFVQAGSVQQDGAGSELLLAGKFGDCCSDSDSSSSSSSHHHEHQHEHQQPRAGGRGAASDEDDTVISYYGMVVQCRQAADPLQGCYLLKTVKQASHAAESSISAVPASSSTTSSSSPCKCTHYALNKVCRGPSLEQQYQAAWLV